MLRTPPGSVRSLTPIPRNQNEDSFEEFPFHLPETGETTFIIPDPPSATQQQGVTGNIIEFLKKVSHDTKEIRTRLTEGKSLTKANKTTSIEICNSLDIEAKTLISIIDNQPRTKPNSGESSPSSDPIQENLILSIEKTVGELKTSLEKQIDDLKETINSATQLCSSPPQSSNQPSTEQPLLLPTPAKPRTTYSTFKPALIIAHKGEDINSSADTLRAWRENISFEDTNFAPANIRYSSNKTIIAEFDKPEQVNLVLSKIGSDSPITAKPAPTLKPMVIVKGIFKNILPETLTQTLIRQNDCIRQNLNKSEDIQLKFTQNNRNIQLYNATFIVTPSLLNSITSTGHLNINHQRVHVENYIPLLQCHKCLMFGHTSKHCRNTATICSHCSSTSHQYKDCQVKSDTGKTNCHNCSQHNKKHNITRTDTGHRATSQHCPRLIHHKHITSTRIDYGV